MSSKNQKLNLDKDELFDLYINKQLTSNEVGKIFNCTSAAVRNYLKKYGIPVRQNAEAVKLERTKWTPEKEAERSKKFIQTYTTNFNNLSDEERAARIAAMTKNSNTPEAIQKAKETKSQNQTFKKSKAEDAFYDKLKLFFTEDDIVRGYVDGRYPFNCDFYIKSKDLFIEYQGHQTHGSQPYDELDPYCRAEADYLEQTIWGSKTYVVRDHEKITTAKQNKINLLLIYPKNDSYLITNGTMKNIGKFDITKINDLC